MTLASRARGSHRLSACNAQRQIGGMILMMVDRRVMDIGELKALLASSDVLTFKGGFINASCCRTISVVRKGGYDAS